MFEVRVSVNDVSKEFGAKINLSFPSPPSIEEPNEDVVTKSSPEPRLAVLVDPVT